MAPKCCGMATTESSSAAANYPPPTHPIPQASAWNRNLEFSQEFRSSEFFLESTHRRVKLIQVDEILAETLNSDLRARRARQSRCRKARRFCQILCSVRRFLLPRSTWFQWTGRISSRWRWLPVEPPPSLGLLLASTAFGSRK